jgi:hypothetical protein
VCIGLYFLYFLRISLVKLIFYIFNKKENLTRGFSRLKLFGTLLLSFLKQEWRLQKQQKTLSLSIKVPAAAFVLEFSIKSSALS